MRAAWLVALAPAAWSADFLALRDLQGAAHQFALHDRITVVAFLSALCPVSNAYNERFERTYREFSPRGVQFLFIASNFNETDDDIRRLVREAGFSFPVYRDPGNGAADLLGAELTPEVFVFDPAGMLRYRGAYDDHRNEARVRFEGLRAALQAVLDGRPVGTSRMRAFGCVLKRPRKGS